ncbi:MAG: virulence-associated E family protein [Erythrobacter sp.]
MSNVIDLQAWKGRVQHNGNGAIKKNLTNLMLYLQNVHGLGENIRWNELTHEAEWNDDRIEEHHLIDIRLHLEAQGFEPPIRDVPIAVARHARDNPYHPIRDYLDGLEWDGKPRLNSWLQDCLGASDTAYVGLVGAKTLIAAVARIYEPGCKVDTMLILEGPQGIKKSSAIAALFSEEWSTESISLFDAHNKMVMSMMGSWVVELAEFTAITRRDPGAVKGLLSISKDKVVLPYAKTASEHARQCIFFGTINPGDTGYLTDATGNRRFWPVEVANANIEKLSTQRDQIWAEAVHRYKAKEVWWFETHEHEAIAQSEAAKREQIDPWVDLLAVEISRQGKARFSLVEAAAMVGLPRDRTDQKSSARIAASLKRLGYVSKPVRLPAEDGKRRSVRMYESKS